jgi:hypothetical protein
VVSRTRLRPLLGVLAGVLVVLVVGWLVARRGPGPTVDLGSTAGQQLASLRVAPDGPMSGYSRKQFGGDWAHEPDGCDARVDVLEQQGQSVAHHGCTVTSGHWLSLYDGVNVTSPHDLDIDHLVPLAEAWRTGAAGWSKTQRVAFANDVKLELVAVTAHSNRSKGDSPPPGYAPPAQGEHCSYAQRWIAVKAAYHLTVTGTEHDWLARTLATCSAAVGGS